MSLIEMIVSGFLPGKLIKSLNHELENLWHGLKGLPMVKLDLSTPPQQKDAQPKSNSELPQVTEQVSLCIMGDTQTEARNQVLRRLTWAHKQRADSAGH